MRALAFALLAALFLAGAIFGYGWYASRQSAAPLPRADLVRVDKSERRLELLRGGEVIKHYSVSLGANPQGHKQQEGDERTPEGRYVLDWRNARSQFYRAIHISYPNAQDRRAARARGVSPGGNILIHGLPNGFDWAAGFLGLVDWTDGCIAVNNSEMDEIWQAVPDGTPIEIQP